MTTGFGRSGAQATEAYASETRASETHDGRRVLPSRLVATARGSARRVRAAGIAAAALLLPACFAPPQNEILRGILDMRSDAGAKPATPRLRRTAAKPARVVSDANTVSFRAPADVPAPNQASVLAPRDLVPPFRVETTVGLCDPDLAPAPGGAFGMRVVERTGAARAFAVSCARIGGITATADFGTPSPAAFADAELLDIALEHTGTEIVAYARDAALDGAWSEVARAAAAGGGPFLPEVRASNFDPGQMVSFYSLRVPENAPYGVGQATPQHEAVRALGEAIEGIATGADALLEGDAGGAAASFADAESDVSAAIAAIESASSPTKRGNAASRRAKKARRIAKAAARNVAKAIRTVEQSGAEKGATAVRKAGAAAISLAKAGDQILPDDLRAAIGGARLSQFLR